jgi:aldehyde dehydrogenase family 7 protein A1
VLQRLELDGKDILPGVYDGLWRAGTGQVIDSIEKATGESMARVATGSASDCEAAIARTRAAYKQWRLLPAPKRGDIVRQIRSALADNVEALGSLVSLEMGKILPEGVGEVQEFVDIADYAVGLSRSMAGQVLPSERPGHVLMEGTLRALQLW